MNKNCPVDEKYGKGLGKGLGKGIGGPGRGKSGKGRTPIDDGVDSNCGCGLNRKQRTEQRIKNRTKIGPGKGLGRGKGRGQRKGSLNYNQIRNSALKIASKNKLNLDNLLIANFGQFCIISDKSTNKMWKIALKQKISQMSDFNEEADEFEGSSYVDTGELDQYREYDESDVMPNINEGEDLDLSGMSETDIYIDEYSLDHIINDKRFQRISIDAKRGIKKIGSAIKIYKEMVDIFSKKIKNIQRTLDESGTEIIDDVVKDREDLSGEIQIYNDLSKRYNKAINSLESVAESMFDDARDGMSINWIARANRAISRAEMIKDTEIVEEKIDAIEQVPRKKWEDRGDVGPLKAQEGGFEIYNR